MVPLALHLNVPHGTSCLWFNQDPQRNVPQVFTKWSEKYNLAESIKPRKMASLYKPGGFLWPPRLTSSCILLNLLQKRVKNDDDDDDDDKCNRLMTNSIVLLHMYLNED